MVLTVSSWAPKLVTSSRIMLVYKDLIQLDMTRNTDWCGKLSLLYQDKVTSKLSKQMNWLQEYVAMFGEEEVLSIFKREQQLMKGELTVWPKVYNLTC